MLTKNILLSLIVIAADPAAAFVVVIRPSPSTGGLASTRLEAAPQEANSATTHDKFVARMQQEWKEEADQLSHHEHAVESDADLAGVIMDDLHKVAPNGKYMEQERHRHDSLYDEVAHAIDVDPDLANVVQGSREPHEVNAGFMDHEAHRHDTLLDEIAHSIDSDPDLSA